MLTFEITIYIGYRSTSTSPTHWSLLMSLAAMVGPATDVGAGLRRVLTKSRGMEGGHVAGRFPGGFLRVSMRASTVLLIIGAGWPNPQHRFSEHLDRNASLWENKRCCGMDGAFLQVGKWAVFEC